MLSLQGCYPLFKFFLLRSLGLGERYQYMIILMRPINSTPSKSVSIYPPAVVGDPREPMSKLMV